MAKTSLDGHWRGINVVAQALRDGGFEVIVLGAATAEQIAAVAVQEDVDIVGLNVGGHVAIVERVLDAIEEQGLTVPVLAGGTLPPNAVERLGRRGVDCFPPGSALADIVERARAVLRVDDD